MNRPDAHSRRGNPPRPIGNNQGPTPALERLARLDRRPAPGRSRRAQRTKVATAGASAGAVIGLTLLYGIANSDGGSAEPATSSASAGVADDAAIGASSVNEQLVVAVDADGNLVSYPAGVDQAVLAEAVANKLAEQSTSSLAPVAAPPTVQLAIPAADAGEAAAGADETRGDIATDDESTSTTSTMTTTTTVASEATTTTTTPSAASSQSQSQSQSQSRSRAPQPKSSGS